MPIGGHIYQVTDAATCFGGMLESEEDNPPRAGFEPWAGVEVTLVLIVNVGGLLGPLYVWEDLGSNAKRTVTTAQDGSFSFTDPSIEQLDRIALWANKPGDEALSVVIRVTSRTFPFQVMYRSDMSLTLKAADLKELNIWLLPYDLPWADGLTAGTVSGVMDGAGLPGNTSITASPSGLAFSGSDDGANIRFGIGILPDNSSDLNSFFDLSLLSWNIHVGFPADVCTSASDILKQIRSGVQHAGTSVSKKVGEMIFNILKETYPIFTDDHIRHFVDDDISMTFINLKYANSYTWPATKKDDATIIFAAEPVIGWPRSLEREPPNYPVDALDLGLPRFNPAPIHPLFGPTSAS